MGGVRSREAQAMYMISKDGKDGEVGMLSYKLNLA